MSCEGILQPENNSGQIEDGNVRAVDSETYFQINLKYKRADICQDVELNNQDVVSSLINVQNVRLIATDWLEHENTDYKSAELLVQNTDNCTGDVWLKSNVANDTDTLLKTESAETGCGSVTGTHSTVLTDVTLKKYIVTTSPEGILSFDLHTDLHEKATATTIRQTNSDTVLTLGEYEAGAVTTVWKRSNESQQGGPIAGRKKGKSYSDSQALQNDALSSSDTASECSDKSFVKEKSITKDIALQCKASLQDAVKDKFECQNSLTFRKYGTEFDTSKDIEDLTEFNLFTFPVDSVFQVDAADEVNNPNVSCTLEEDEKLTLQQTKSKAAITHEAHGREAQQITVFAQSLPSNRSSNNQSEQIGNLEIAAQSEEKIVAYSRVIDIHDKSAIQSDIQATSHRMLSESVTFPRKKMIVTVSADKTKNNGDTVIDTFCGGQFFTGKRTKYLESVSPWISENANSTVQCKESNSELTVHEVYPSQLATEIGNSDIALKSYSKPAQSEDSKPGDHVVEQALAEVGVSAEDLCPITTENDQKLWVCPVKSCNRIFPRLCMLRIHVLRHYGIRPYKCDYEGCEWSFYSYVKLKRHKETHLKKKDFVCPIDGCGRRYTTVYNLNTHVKLHENPAVIICPVDSCSARFQTKRSMEIHMRTHDSLHAPYKCTFEGCGKVYYSSNCLHSHSHVHLRKEEELRCQWEGCGKLFDQPCRLKAHMRIHTGVKPYKCTFKNCNWAFESASKLKRHQHKHTNERKHHCLFDGCGKSFLRTEHLKEHALTHMPERTFKCLVENCGQKFSAKSSLYVHSKKHNTSKGDLQVKETFCCPIEKCNRSYSMKSSLRQHMLKIHTPVLAQDTTHLDYIILLTASDDSGSLEGLEMLSETGQLTSHAGRNAAVKGMNILPASSTLTTEEVQSDINDLMNKDFGTRTRERMAQIFLEPTETEITTTSIQGMQDDPGTEVISDTCFIVTAGNMPVPLTEETVVTSEFPEENTCKGSARTDFTYEDVCTWKKHTMSIEEGIASSTISSPLKQTLSSDICACDSEIPQIVVQAETLNTQADTQEANLMTISNTFGEFQVLLLGQQSSVKQFAESTINLRDLQ